ncbi:hypothetical protein [Methylocaldum sp.]|uniref:hypothetical protein n=1 Tax=Methylocaldum sp. TaxID=1969727 RepID=UPI002D6BF2CC|nr:hypothetical protein [Methylocaldum sp.]HYE35524.1 hypothetical protein [Methylocaldum sp.]
MNAKPISIPGVLLAVAVGSGVLPVQAREEAYPPAFSQVDQNQDGYISANESKAVPGLSEYLITLDQNGDGKLSPKEYEDLKTLAPKEGGGPSPAPITPPAPVPMNL